MVRTLNSMSVQRHVTPFRCTRAPPTRSPGRNDPSRRIGSASCDGLLRIVRVSFVVFCVMSLRDEKRSSSRISGTEKSCAGERIAPRSSATTLCPASVSSFASIPPVQPRPTSTTSTSGSFFAMIGPSSTHVRDAGRLAGKFLVLVIHDILRVHLDYSGKTDHLPSRFVFIAAIDWVGEHAFHHVLINGGEKHARRQSVVEVDFAGVEPGEHFLAL